MRRVFVKSWPILLILFIVSSFFWKFFIKGMIPIPADITVGMYFPWLDYKWGYAVGVPVKNSLLSDVVSQIYPLRIHAVNLIKNGSFPLWNRLMFGGYPLLGNMQIGVLNPTNIFYFFLPSFSAWGWQIFFQPLFACFFTYLFLRSLKIGRLASIFGGISYSFAGFSLIWMEWGVHGFAVAFLPLQLYAVSGYFREKNSFFGPLIALSICLSLFAGYPQVVFYSLLVLVAFIIFNFEFEPRRFLGFGFWFILGIALSAIQLLPAFELFVNSQRKLEVLSREQGHLPWEYLVSFFAPDFFGNQTTGNFWGKGDYTNNVGYTGLITFILAIYSLFFLKERKVKFFFWTFLLSVIFALPEVLALPEKVKLISGQGSMAATRILFLANFSLSVLAAFSFDKLLVFSGRKREIMRIFYLPSIVLGGVFLGSFWALKIFSSPTIVANDPFFADILVTWLRNLRVGMRNLVLPSVLLFCLAFLFFLAEKIKTIRKISLVLVFVLMVLELFRFGWKYTPFIKPGLIFPSTPAIDFLKSQSGVFRVDGGDAIPMNMLAAYELESMSAYDPMYPLQTAKFLSLADGSSAEQSKSRYGRLDTFNSPLVDLANICYVLAVKRDQVDKADSSGIPGGQFRLEKLKLVFEDKTTVVLRNKQCFPRAWLSRSFIIEENLGWLAKKLTEGITDLQKVIFLEKDPQVRLNQDDIKNNETVDWISREANKQELQILVDKPAFLFISDSFYPGWKASVDGNKTEIFRADFNFRAVFIPEGKHLVSFVYDPLSVKIGSMISLISLLVLMLALIAKLPLLKKKWL